MGEAGAGAGGLLHGLKIGAVVIVSHAVPGLLFTLAALAVWRMLPWVVVLAGERAGMALSLAA